MITPRYSVDYRAARAVLYRIGDLPARRAANVAAQAGARVIVDESRVIVRGIKWKTKSTGALLKSIGITKLKDDSRLVGVRRTYRHPKTGKIPNMYAHKVVDVHFDFMKRAVANKGREAQIAMERRYLEKFREEIR